MSDQLKDRLWATHVTDVAISDGGWFDFKRAVKVLSEAVDLSDKIPAYSTSDLVAHGRTVRLLSGSTNTRDTPSHKEHSG